MFWRTVELAGFAIGLYLFARSFRADEHMRAVEEELQAIRRMTGRRP